MINDLLDPTGQNLRVREDAQVFSTIYFCSCIMFILIYDLGLIIRNGSIKLLMKWLAICISFKLFLMLVLCFQGTYVEGIKEEVVLSPGHALSFIAAGEGALWGSYCCFSFLPFP